MVPSVVGWWAAIEDEESCPAARLSAFLGSEMHITHGGHGGVRHADGKHACLAPAVAVDDSAACIAAVKAGNVQADARKRLSCAPSDVDIGQ